MDQTKIVVEAGIQSWNNNSSATGVVFEAASATETPDLTIRRDDANSGGCAAINTGTGVLSYSFTYEGFANQNGDAGAGGIAHEIGHFLGLDDAGTSPSSPTIMNNISTCADMQSMATKTVQANDASKANTCSSSAMTFRTMQYVGSSDPSGGGGYCVNVLSPVYAWNDGWHIVGLVVDYSFCY